MIRLFHQYISPKTIYLILWEGLLILASLAAAELCLFGGFDRVTTGQELFRMGVQALLMLIVFQLCFYINELYDPQVVRYSAEQMLRLVEALGGGCILLGLLTFAIPAIHLRIGLILIALVVLSASASVSRFAFDAAWASGASRNRLLILGGGPLAVKVGRELNRRADLGFELAGFLTNGAEAPGNSSLFGSPVLGRIEDLRSIVAEQSISRIVVALENGRGLLPVRDLVKLRARGVVIEDAHTAISALTGRVWLDIVQPSWFLYSEGFHRSRLSSAAKRLNDVVFGVTGLVLSAPLMALIALAVRLDSKGPALYRQRRVGLAGATFDVLKFRSMYIDAEARGAQWACVDDPRITRVGRFIRKYRLDELPQFVNVIRGEMSFIGPRPERPVFVDQLKEVIPYYEERHSVRPGLTGWAQVQYPYGATVEDAYRKHEYDLFYLKNMSILFDWAILIQTIRIVLFGRGSR
mgnify:CR=1 FL=1